MANDRNDDKRKVTRRQLFGTGAAVGAGVLATRIGLAFGKGKKAPEQVPRKVLGKTGQKIPILLFGASMDLDRVFDPKLAEAFRYGVDYIDAGRVYGGGRCEAAVAAYHTRAKNRKQLWITTKSSDHDPKGFERQVATSLKELKTDYVDLYFLHALRDADHLNKDLAKTVEALKKAGKIRYFGFSCHHGNVAELLTAASKHSWVDSVMFRYNFRQYGNKALNKAIDAAARANVGLIAMKTQGSAASFADEWKKFTKSGKWTKHQAVLKAVWADDRITAAVSSMNTIGKLKQNIAAAVDKTKLSRGDWQALDRYAAATRQYACDGCDHLCGPAVGAPVAIADTMRYLMYHDVYGEKTEARRLFAELPEPSRQLDGIDFSPGVKACPHNFDLVAHMARARKVLT